MKSFFAILKAIGILLLGFVVIFLVNLPHDFIINSFDEGTAKDHVPLGTPAEVISLCIVFLAGVAASVVVSVLARRNRRLLLVILTGLFVLIDFSGVVVGPFASTSLWYRILMVALCPLEVWIGYVVGSKIKPNAQLGIKLTEIS